MTDHETNTPSTDQQATQDNANAVIPESASNSHADSRKSNRLSQDRRSDNGRGHKDDRHGRGYGHGGDRNRRSGGYGERDDQRWDRDNDRGRSDRNRSDRHRDDHREGRNDRRRGGSGNDRRQGSYRNRDNRYGDRDRGNYNDGRKHNDNRNGDRQYGGNGRGHAQRAGAGRRDYKQDHRPMRSGFREERLNKRQSEPDLPTDIDIQDLDPMVLQDLKVLAKDNADTVAKHMIMAATLMEDDPQLALRHARAAKDRAGRVSVARETNGIAAYRAGEWKEALSELRAARRISGGPGLLAVVADCERGLGRPIKAIEMARSEEAAQLDKESQVELAIVVAGARLDLDQIDSALVTLEQVGPNAQAQGLTAARLSYAYADTLFQAGRKDEAKQWFEAAAAQDVDGLLDTEERLAAFE